ncbi:MAG: GNAT family N-acetyltransferase [Chloroflexota bacterium]|nr:GNAT family N-acetyltransferase [Chloroflexota bacterium]
MPEPDQTTPSPRLSPDRASTGGSAAGPTLTVRPFTEADRPFYQSIVQRLNPGRTASPRDPAVISGYFRRLAAGEVDPPAGTEIFVAVDAANTPLGVISIYPGADYFTGHRRAYVETLVVAAEAEGRGAGRTLMDHADRWARERGMIEVSLDVFAENTRACDFYERHGYRVDHMRMTKRL